MTLRSTALAPAYALIRSYARQRREHWHTQRAALFHALMRPQSGARVLDVGGNDGEFMARLRADADLEVTIADVEQAALEKARARGFQTVRLVPEEPLPFADGSFDIVFCNSVIEHVTGGGGFHMCAEPEWLARSSRHQQAFARDLRRVGRGYFVQTPHRAFPIEAHTWLPLVGWLSHDATVRLVRVTDRVWVKHCGSVDWNLLAEPEMKQLFPGAELHVERVLGMPKSIVAYSRG